MSKFILDAKNIFLTIPQISNEINKEIAYNRLLEAYKDKLVCFIVSQEEHKEQGTHLHLFIEFNKKFRTRRADIFDFIAGKHPNIQSARNREDVIKYVIKDGNFMSYNISPEDYIKEKSEHTKRKTKGDFHQLAEAIKNGENSVKELNNLFPHLFLKYGDHISKYIKFIKDINNRDEIDNYYNNLYSNCKWSPFQDYLLKLVNSPVDGRKVSWIYDRLGNNGKSFIANYMRLYLDAYIITGGKSADIYRHYDNNKIVIYDLPRDYMAENVSIYSTIECFKNGYILDTKYEGQKKTFIPPHIIVLSNNLPDTTKLSKDRWNIINLEDYDFDAVSNNINNVLSVGQETKEEEEKEINISYNSSSEEEPQRCIKDYENGLIQHNGLDMDILRGITHKVNGIVYLGRYRYDGIHDRFFDIELIEFFRL